jgi:hypothetical protein
MKEEFNKQKIITVTGIDGVPRTIDIYTIESIKPAVSLQAGSIIKFNEGEDFQAKEQAEEIAKLINGDPDPSLVRKWEEEILARHSRAALLALAELQREHHQSMLALQDKAAQKEKENDILERSHTFRIAQYLADIDKKPRSKLGRRLFEQSEKTENAFMAGLYKNCAAILAGRDDILFDAVKNIQEQLKKLKENAVKAAQEKEQEERTKDRTYRVELERLQGMINDPQMSMDDRGILQQKIRDYRQGHEDPQFQFVRDREGNYREKGEIEGEERERSRAVYEREVARSRAEREQGHNRDSSRDYGYER